LFCTEPFTRFTTAGEKWKTAFVGRQREISKMSFWQYPAPFPIAGQGSADCLRGFWVGEANKEQSMRNLFGRK